VAESHHPEAENHQAAVCAVSLAFRLHILRDERKMVREDPFFHRIYIAIPKDTGSFFRMKRKNFGIFAPSFGTMTFGQAIFTCAVG
jgi:hypothetical protein